ncbi:MULTISPECIES: hypothetical protein [unclassified Caulobacter]|uniref:hypothetical protein n=1 Tax=unclassified Caulobacter TaxID=2648921 RepID=UPI0006F87C3C|nr:MULTISPECIES: hypothetical protein [unclassified Caulobacter]KQV55951.1 hypothetical protein ASC62_18720 [Caulobacter sp. Root342]KQV70875.1 hypothetical protein ASC70_04535 [Caulobacter sp. Root343]
MRSAAVIAIALSLATSAAAQTLDLTPAATDPAAAAVARWEADSGVGVAPDLRERLIAQTDKTLAKPSLGALLGPAEKAKAVDKAIDAYLSPPAAGETSTRRYRQLLGDSLDERVAHYGHDNGLVGALPGAGPGAGGGFSAGFDLWGIFKPIDRTWTLIVEAAPSALDFRINDLPLPRSAKDQYLVVQATARVLLRTASGFVCKVEVKRDEGDRTAHCLKP